MADTYDPNRPVATDTVASAREARAHNHTWAWMLAALGLALLVALVWIALNSYNAMPPSEYMSENPPSPEAADAPLAMPEQPDANPAPPPQNP